MAIGSSIALKEKIYELKPYKAAATTCTGLLFKPGDTEIQTITQ
jgi:hypothetical protein